MDKIWYGADYNPEQWPTQIIDDDIALMKEAGVTTVTLGVFSWGLLEPRPGEYDFGWLDEVIDKLTNAGIAIDLATGTATPPVWMAEEYPQTLPVDINGRTLRQGSRQQFCPSSPIYREFAARLASKMAERYGSHPGVIMWHIGNEYGCHVSDCFCETSTAAFRAWLKDRYGTIEALNEAWGTAFWSQHYTSFDHVRLPGAMPTLHNPNQVTDMKRFTSDQLRACYLAEKEAIAAHSTLPVTTNFMGDFPGADYRAWAKDVDVVTDDSYPDPASPFATAEVAWASDLSRSLGDGKPFLLMEQAPGMVQWRRHNARKRPGQFFLHSLQRVAHGADGIMQFQWRQSVRGSETFHSAMVPHAGRESRTWAEVVQLGQALDKLAPIVGSEVESHVGILIDWDAQWQRAASIGLDPQRAGKAAREWHATCFEAGFPVTFVFPDQELTGYRILIVPELFAMSEDVAYKLHEAAKGGTQVIVTCATNVLDATGRALEGGYARFLEPLTGVRVLDHRLSSLIYEREVDETEDITAGITTTSNDVQVSLAPGPDGPGRWSAMSLAGGQWAEDIVATDADILAVFNEPDLAGQPAITHVKRGFGGATYVATDLNTRSRAALFSDIRRRASMMNPREGVPAGVEQIVRGGFRFILNHSDQEVTLKDAGTDVLTGTHFKKKTVIAPRSAVVFDERK